MIWADVRSVDIIHELLAQGVDPDFIRWGNIKPLSRVKELLYVVDAAKNKIQKRLLSPYDKTSYTLLRLDYGDIVVEYNYKRVHDIFTFGVKKTAGIWMVDRYDRSINNLYIRVLEALRNDWLVICFEDLDKDRYTMYNIIELFMEFKVIYLILNYHPDDQLIINMNFINSMLIDPYIKLNLENLIKEHRDHDPVKYALWEKFINTIETRF